MSSPHAPVHPLARGMSLLWLTLLLFFMASERPIRPELAQWSPSQLDALEKKRAGALAVIARAVALLEAEDAPSSPDEWEIVPVDTAGKEIPRPFSAVQGDMAAAFAWKNTNVERPAFSPGDGMAVVVPPADWYGGLLPDFYYGFYADLTNSLQRDLGLTGSRLVPGPGWKDPPAFMDVYVQKDFTRQTEAGGLPVAQGLGVVMLRDLPVFLMAGLPAGDDPEAARRLLRERLERFGRLLTELDASSPLTEAGGAFLDFLANPVLLLVAAAAGWVFAAEGLLAAAVAVCGATLITLGMLAGQVFFGLGLSPSPVLLGLGNVAAGGGIAFMLAWVRRRTAGRALAERRQGGKAPSSDEHLDAEAPTQAKKKKKRSLPGARMGGINLAVVCVAAALIVTSAGMEARDSLANRAGNNAAARLAMLEQESKRPLSPAEAASRLAGILERPMRTAPHAPSIHAADQTWGTIVFVMEKNQAWKQLPGILDDSHEQNVLLALLKADSDAVDMKALENWSCQAPPAFAPSALEPLPVVPGRATDDEEYARRWKRFWRGQVLDILGMDASEYWAGRLTRSPDDAEARQHVEALAQAGRPRAADALIESRGLAEAAALGSPRARTRLAQRFLEREEGNFRPSEDEPGPAALAVLLQEAALRDGDATTFEMLSLFHLNGIGVAEDREQALTYVLASQFLEAEGEEEKRAALHRSEILAYYAGHGFPEDVTERAYDQALALARPFLERRKEAAARQLAGRAAVIRNMREELPWMRWAFVSAPLRAAMGDAMRKKLDAEGGGVRGKDGRLYSHRPLAWEEYLEAWREYGTELPLD